MATKVLSDVKQAQLLSELRLDEVIETICQAALMLTQERAPAPLRGMELRRQLRRTDFVEGMKDRIASGVATVLAEHDPGLKAIYIYDPSANPDSDSGADVPIDPTLHLLVVVEDSTETLKALISSIDLALTNHLSQLPSPSFERRTSILDVCLLTHQDIQKGQGYTMLLSSVHAPPIQVWQRQKPV